MLVNKFPTLVISRKGNKLIDIKLEVPEREFPKKVWLETRGGLLGGYFVNYNSSISLENIKKAILSKNWAFFNDLIGDYWLVYENIDTGETKILTSPNGKFASYYSISDNQFFLSPDFAWVLSKVGKPKLDSGESMDFLARSIWISDGTIVSQIKQIPPGCLLNVGNNLDVSIEQLRGNIELLNNQDPYTSVEKFVSDFLDLLHAVVGEQVNRLEGMGVSADLSSGFDCSLICYVLSTLIKKGKLMCYSEISEAIREDTDWTLVEEFAKKHQLRAQVLRTDSLTPFASKLDLNLVSRRPSQLFKAQLYESNMIIAKDGFVVRFTGVGGDEIYQEYKRVLWRGFYRHEEFFGMVKKLHVNIGSVLTDKALEMLLDKKRFTTKFKYESTFSPSAVSFLLDSSDLYWLSNIWPMTPFVDPRLVRLASRIPRKGRGGMSKQDLYKNRTDIFPLSFFRRKGGPMGQLQKFLYLKRNWVIDLLRSSALGRSGWIRANEIAKDIANGSIQKYFQGDSLSFLINSLELEYFIQVNNITVPAA